MKYCPKCHREYPDETLNYCLDDGEPMVDVDLPSEARTAVKIPPPHADTPRRGDSADRTELLPHAPRKADRRLWIIAAVAAFMAAAGVFVYRSLSVQTNSPISSIAVLPFQNRNTDADSEYLSDGLAESLIYRLSQLPDLKVSPTSTVFRYRGSEADPVKIGGELGVNAVLSGRIVQHGDSLTISVDLVDVRDNRQLWGEQYNRKISDLLSTQREIAREIVDKLKLGSESTGQDLAKNYTESNEAYKLYLKGRFYWNKRTPDALDKAIDYFQQAIGSDPRFALAHAGLADCYVVPSNGLPPKVAMPKAKAAAERALALDNTLAEAHTSLARVLMSYEWDWAGAENEFKRAIELNPKYPVAHEWYGGYLEATGNSAGAIAERKLALELDPLSLIINFELGQAYFYARDYDRAIQQYQKTLDLDPGFPAAYQFLPVAYEQKGNYDEAIARFKASPLMNRAGEWTFTKAGLGHVYGLAGQKTEALAMVDELKELSKKQYVPAASIALVYAGIGDKDQAFEWLNKAYEDHAFQIQWIGIDPRWDNLRPDPRFQDLIRKIGLAKSTG